MDHRAQKTKKNVKNNTNKQNITKKHQVKAKSKNTQQQKTKN